MEGRDPLRTLYVGVLSTLLVLTGCVGFFGDDVVDSVSAQVSVDDFATMQSTVSALETLAASHTTDIMALEDRIESLEMGPDMSTFATDIQLMQLQTQVNILQSQYDAHQHSSGGEASRLHHQMFFRSWRLDSISSTPSIIQMTSPN